MCSEEGKFPAGAKIENVLSHLPNGEGDGHPTVLGFQHPREPAIRRRIRGLGGVGNKVVGQ